MHSTSTSAADSPRMQRFHALYRDEFAFVWAAARRLGVPSVALEDVVQDVFITVYRRLEQLRYEVSPRAWLYGITRRIASRYRRGAFRQLRRTSALAAVTAAPAEPPQERAVEAHRLDLLLHELGDGTRSVWEMAELLGMSGPEIASELAVPLNTVYSRLRLARTQLQRMLGELELTRTVADRRARDEPPARAAQRSWLVILPGLGKPGAVLGLLAGTRVAVATTLLLVGAGAALVVDRGAAPAPPPTAPAPRAPPRPASTHVTAPAPVDEPLATSPPPTQRPRVTATRDRFADEVALLDHAHARLGAGDVAGALAAVAEHAREFADGDLLDVREAARVQALCLAGDLEQATRVAARLLAEHPRSAVAQRHKDFFCPR